MAMSMLALSALPAAVFAVPQAHGDHVTHSHEHADEAAVTIVSGRTAAHPLSVLLPPEGTGPAAASPL